MLGKLGLPVYLARANADAGKMLQQTGLISVLQEYGGGTSVSVHDAVKDLLQYRRARIRERRRGKKSNITANPDDDLNGIEKEDEKQEKKPAQITNPLEMA